MEKGLIVVKPAAYYSSDRIANDIEEYSLSIDDRIKQRWTREKIRSTYPAEKYPNWPMASFVDNIIFSRFGKDPLIEAIFVSSSKDTIKKVKKLVGPLDAAYAQRPEDSETLRYKYGLKERRVMIIDNKPYYFYFNGTHSSTDEEFRNEEKLYSSRTTL